MLKDLVNFTNIEGKPDTKTVFFNLTQFEVEMEMELEVIQDRFQKFMDEVVGPDGEPTRDMTPPEKREIFGMVKEIMKHAYGIKDGLNHYKDDPRGSGPIWREFEASGAFSAYVYQLFSTEGAVNRFMAGIWPQGLERQTPDGSVFGDSSPATVTQLPGTSRDNMGLTVETQDAPDEETNWHMNNFTRDQLIKMSEDDFKKVTDASIQGRNVPLPLIQISGIRESRKAGE